MAIYDLGTASLSANGEVTGVGTTWKAPLTLIRVGATIVFKTEPVQIYTISEIISDTQINVYNPNSETVPAGTGYAILAHDGITVQGLAQDVAETLRYYQSKETSIESLIEVLENADIDVIDGKIQEMQQLLDSTVASEASAKASSESSLEYSNNSLNSSSESKTARDEAVAARDATIEAINNAGDAGTLVTLAGSDGASLIGITEGITVQDALTSTSSDLIKLKLNWAIENGYTDSGLTFQSGGELNTDDSTKVIYDSVSKAWYSYASTLPVTVPAGFNPVGSADWKPQNDPNLRDDLATPGAVDVSGGNVTVEAVSPFIKDLPLNTFASKVATIDMFTGVVSDGVTDTRQAVQDAIIACASAGVRLRITAGVYAFANWLGIPSNADIVFDNNAVFKLLNHTTIDAGGSSPVGFGGFVVIGYLWDTQATKVEGKNIHIEGMNLDVNGLDGENAFGGVLCTNVRVVNTRIKGTVHSNARLGGKAVQFEGGMCQDVQIDNLYIENCSIGISSQGLAGSTTNNQRCITYNDVFMRDVGVPFMSYGQSSNPGAATSNEQSVIINGLVMHNCGSSKSFTSDPLGAGLFCADRGANITINNVRLFNDYTYGAIGAIFRGPMFNVNVSNAYFEAPYIIAIVDQTAVGFGSPSGAAFNSYAVTRDFRVKLTNLDFVAKASSSSVGPHDLEISLDLTSATIATIFDTNIATSGALATNAMLHLTNTVTGESTGLRSFSDIYLQGNTPALCMKVKDRSSTWVPTDASGGSIALTINGMQKLYRQGESITACLNVTYPTTSDKRPAAISGLGVLGLSGVNYAGLSSTLNAGGATAVVKGGESFIRFLNNDGTNMTNADLSGKNIAVVIRYLI